MTAGRYRSYRRALDVVAAIDPIGFTSRHGRFSKISPSTCFSALKQAERRSGSSDRTRPAPSGSSPAPACSRRP
jgi:hypothetical protein